jgi:hypothetical protein
MSRRSFIGAFLLVSECHCQGLGPEVRPSPSPGELSNYILDNQQGLHGSKCAQPLRRIQARVKLLVLQHPTLLVPLITGGGRVIYKVVFRKFALFLVPTVVAYFNSRLSFRGRFYLNQKIIPAFTHFFQSSWHTRHSKLFDL